MKEDRQIDTHNRKGNFNDIFQSSKSVRVETNRLRSRVRVINCQKLITINIHGNNVEKMPRKK